MIGRGSVAGGPPEFGPEKWHSTGSRQPFQVTPTQDLWVAEEWLPVALVVRTPNAGLVTTMMRKKKTKREEPV
jgi:hypothetical protein